MSALTSLFRRRSPLPRRKACGLTLIELMVAMALLGVVGVLTWRATSQLVDARERIAGELARWQAVVHATALIERELMQIAPPVLAEGVGGLPALELEAAADGSRSRLAWAVVGGEHEIGRVEIRHLDGRLEAWVWPDLEARATPTRLPLLDEVPALRWRLLSANRPHLQWPLTEGSAVGATTGRRSALTDAPALPEAFELTLELADVGTVTRVFAPR
jgi:general secretion pathway protein J